MPEVKVNPATTAVGELAQPLEEFYRLQDAPLPALEGVVPEEMPEAYRTLLVHKRDMTPTLERHHGGRIHLQVLRSFIRGEYYYRLVVLRLDRNGQPVEFGANRISLNYFSCTARRLIVEEYVPLGTILDDFSIVHHNQIQAFLRIEADDLIGGALRLNGSTLLYGRRNRMVDPYQRTLSEVIEILPPPLE